MGGSRRQTSLGNIWIVDLLLRNAQQSTGSISETIKCEKFVQEVWLKLNH